MEAQYKECCDYIRDIYSKLCFFPESIEVVYELEDPEEGSKLPFITFTIKGDRRDDGILIGRGGAMVNSVRVIVHAFTKAHLDGSPHVVEVKDHMDSGYTPQYRRRPKLRTR